MLRLGKFIKYRRERNETVELKKKHGAFSQKSLGSPWSCSSPPSSEFPLSLP